MTEKPIESRPPFVGRVRHLAQIRELIDASIPTVVEGEAGIGKSALLAELAHGLTADGYDVVRIYGTEATRSFALTHSATCSLPPAQPASQAANTRSRSNCSSPSPVAPRPHGW